MEVLYARCAGLDVHKQTVKVCLLIRQEHGQIHKEFRTYGTTTQELLDLADWLGEQGCTHIALEATGVYWKPIYNEARKVALNCWSSMLGISKPSQGERRISVMQNGLPICFPMDSYEPVSFRRRPRESCAR